MSGTSRGSRLSRAVSFFREAPYDEARVAFVLVQETMAERKHDGAKPTTLRPAKPRSRSQSKRIATQQGATPSAEQPLVQDAPAPDPFVKAAS